ncbi:mutarotase [Galbibacter sp. EGI 63066]|uniref:2'-5' RNA ligase family protein n=1 Tax=Galbibacter sp. EGI 63066 TaxID=2993559 RepID=UPI0022499FE2|nr:mutarotase [Galbibacter sp. EGI 63066]MCX2680408.1 mutarotase [Galbibacter sp. EGI 63066]
MNLKEHYRKLYNESINKISSDKYEIDNLIDSKFDQRFGITLLIRPSDEIKENIQKLLNELKTVEPNQYYYLNSDIHITIMSIISCYEGFDIKKIELPKYIELIKKCLPANQNLNIQFKGLTASDSCIMLQGFMDNDVLNEIRNKLRVEFKNSRLEQSLDKRYPIQTAHSTIVRFRKRFEQKGDFLKIIDKYSNHDFGSFEVKKLEFVYNDWYQRKGFVKKLYEFEI